MLKGFTQAFLVGVLEVIVFALLLFLLKDIQSLGWLIFMIAVLLLVLYLVYLKRHIDEWFDRYPKQAVQRPMKIIVHRQLAKPMLKFQEKPAVVSAIIKVPRNDIDYIRLLDYIKYNRYYGRSVDKIKDSLFDAGWDEITVNRAFRELGEIHPRVDLKKQQEYNEAVDKKLMELKRNVAELAAKKQEVKPVYIERKQKIKKIYIEKKRPKPGKPTYFYIGSDVTGVYHTTKCRLGKSIKNKNKLKFRNSLEAQKAKLRPCNLCEPNKK